MALKIYTKTGDAGQTALFGGRRLPKNHHRIEAYGTVDELNSNMGMLRDLTTDAYFSDLLKTIQDRLFRMGANLASDPEKHFTPPDIQPADIELLEQEIDKMEETLPPLKNFILPGGHPAVSQSHIARCVCRRAERMVVAINQEEEVDPMVLKYLNRLSDFLFVLARKLGHDLGAEEVIWKPR